MNQLRPPVRFDWQVYRGRDLFTADNQRVGIVSDVRKDPWSGDLFLIVRDDDPCGVPLGIPTTRIGVATRLRLMLDVVGKKAPVREWREIGYRNLFPA